MSRSVSIRREAWPIAGGFTISRGTKTDAEVVIAEICANGHTGRGECVPYPRYGETVPGVVAQIEAVVPALEAGMNRYRLRAAMPAGAARNAVDCALWDLEAKERGEPAWRLAGLPPPGAVTTAFTISLGSPEAMARAAQNAASRPLLKVKLGGEADEERIAAVRQAAPAARLIADANEAWEPAQLEPLMAACAAAGVELLEQPLPAGKDDILARLKRPLAVCADESVHVGADLKQLRGRYDAVNIKLDKAGGLTGALELAEAAKAAGFGIMVGCMLATSLSMAPAMLVAQLAQWADLDGPLLLARDRAPGLRYEGSLAYPPDPGLWG